MKIGIAGTGRMGAAIAERLMAEGYDVIVWNRSKDKLKPLLDAGATEAATPAELVSIVDAIITILTNADSIDAVYHGPDGLLSTDVTGKLFIEMSTVRPVIEEKLAADVRAKGGAMVDAPVGGTVGPAKQGMLVGVIGGKDEDVARARPILEKLCKRVDHVGPVGAGASFKLAINLPLVVYWQALGEALSLCMHHGVDPSHVTELMADTSAGPNMMKARAGAVADALKGETVPGTFDIDSIRKDMRTMLEEAAARGVDLPLVSRALSCYDECSAAGLGPLDPAMETAYWVGKGAGKGA